ncbi:MAG: type 1 glutamine amidotransferase domain-containing protein [Paraglaciecola sp.]|uniref:type 1 glutamine amidotransferase domain-containing protein n=1 Tax=Paraglaciecola sp. TaxID=1920173 RepID=UPI0032675F5A
MQNAKQLIFILLVLLLIIANTEVLAKSTDLKVLMVVSGYGQQQGKEAPGYEFNEFAKAYLVFKHNNLLVDIASPQGGSVEADRYDPSKLYNQEVLTDPSIMAKLDNTLSTAQLTADDYAGVFIVGGKGAMFDLPKDTSLQQIIADIYQQQGIVAAVCHGPAALVDVKLADGSYLVANKAVNGFTNQEENLFGTKWMKDFAFMLEDKLVERGGKFQSSDIMLEHVAVEERLITGQNPSSTVVVATELVKSLGIKPKPLASYEDDRTLGLIAQLLGGDLNAVQALKNAPDQYNIKFVGMYGYQYLEKAKSQQEYQHALTLMTLAQVAMNNPKLEVQIAKAQHKIGDKHAAADTLNKILATKPDFKPALDMLSTLSL